MHSAAASRLVVTYCSTGSPHDQYFFRRPHLMVSGRRRAHAEVPDGFDEFTRECLAIDVAGGIRSGRVIEVLTQLVSVHGAPRYVRSDNGPEFVARAILRWLQTAQIETAFIDPGKPWQNAADESFNGKFRDQHLSLQWFRTRVEAKVRIEEWRRHYERSRTHLALAKDTPIPRPIMGDGVVIAIPDIGGLHHHYERRAA
jgi:putative transposase